MSCPPRLATIVFATVLLAAGPALAADPMPGSSTPSTPACAPTVSAALTTWDTALAGAERLGSRAAAVAREKGRDLLLPFLGIDTSAAAEQPGAGKATGDVADEVAASRADPARRERLCVAITSAATEAKETAKGAAGAGLDALRRAVDGLRGPAAPPRAPTDNQDKGLIKT